MGSSCSLPEKAILVAPSCESVQKKLNFWNASGVGDVVSVASLILQRADVNQVNRSGRSALHVACVRGHRDVVRLLIDNRATPHTKDCWGNEPIRDAAVHGHYDIVHILLQSGCNPPADLQSELDMRLFHITSKDDLSGIKQLIENTGLSINTLDYYGRTALHLASERGHIHIVEYLISKGADVNIRDNQGVTALSLAIAQHHKAVQRLLQAAGANPSHNRAIDDMKQNRSLKASFAVMEAFPQQIAVAMLEGRSIEPISKDCVSLLFSDIAGFTGLSSSMDPSKVSRMLSNLFHKFDRLAYLHGVQKVDVVGDAYIAATNFSDDQPTDHAARLARFAVDISEAARATPIDEDRPEELGCVQLRVGMHCGAVSGTVVGRQVRKYTLFGDAVNTASRMESCGLAGRIQCSETIAALITEQANDLLLCPRKGGVDVKGKGHMQTFWVNSLRRGGLAAHGSCPNLFGRQPTPAGAGGDSESRSIISVDPDAALPRSLSLTAAGTDTMIDMLLSAAAPEDRTGSTAPPASAAGGEVTPMAVSCSAELLLGSGEVRGVQSSIVGMCRRPAGLGSTCSPGVCGDGGSVDGSVGEASDDETSHAAAAVPAGPGAGPEAMPAPRAASGNHRRGLVRSLSQTSLKSQSQIYRL